MNYNDLPLTDIAKRIDAHLKRFERDPEINKNREANGLQLKTYYDAHASRAGAFVHVVYIAYQGGANIKSPAAIRYLAWLDAGNVGTHHQVPEGFTVEMKEEL